MTSPETKPIAVLLVDDDPGDVVLIQEAFEHNKVRNTLRIAGDGVEAMDFVRTADVRPDLVPINLPRKDGREVLAEVKPDPALRSVRQIDEFFVTVVKLPGQMAPPGA